MEKRKENKSLERRKIERTSKTGVCQQVKEIDVKTRNRCNLNRGRRFGLIECHLVLQLSNLWCFFRHGQEWP